MPNKDTKEVANYFKKRNKPSKVESFFKNLFSSEEEKDKKPKEESEEGSALARKFSKSIKSKREGNNEND